MVGYFKAATGSIANTYVTGNVSAQTDVGGLAGEILYGTVTNVYSTANVTGDRGVGGLMGSASEDNITNAYSTGLVTGNSYVGGLLGWEWYTTVTNSFWDKQTSGQNSSYSNKGTGKTTVEMKLQSTFTGWDFTAGTGKWKIKEIASLYKSYPYLQGFTYDEPGASPVVNPIPGLTDLLYSGGIGTSENPYQIATLADLKFLSENSDYWAKYFIQTANIDATATSGWNSNAGFSPIGNSTTAFTGNYNGQNHTIAGLFINRPATDYIGMFGYNTGTISNLGLTNVNITGKYRVGGLVGMDNPGANITRVYTTGSVTANYGDGGGLVGTHNSGSISNAYSRASVSGAGCRGGLIGWYQSGTVSNVYSTGSVSSSGACIGGLIGGSNGSVTNGFWDTQTSGQATSAGGTGKTTAEMKNVFTFIQNCWDFQAETGNGANDYWGISATDNSGYPFLSWQGYTNTATFPSTITIGTTASPTCGWSINGGVLSASTDVSIHANDIKTALVAGNLTIQASNEIIINASIAPALTAARTLTLKAGGNISMYASASIAPSTEFALNTIFWSDADATNGGAVVINNSASINTKGGHVWIGGGSGSADWNGLTVGNGYAKSAAGDAVALSYANLSTSGGDIQINGESTATETGSDGISISSESTILAGAGNISLYGIGGLVTDEQADCDGIRIDGPITTTTGNITLTGSSTPLGNCEGISMSTGGITSTSGNISLIADIFWMSSEFFIGSSGTLTLKPLNGGSTIGIAGGAGTLSLSTDYFTTNFVDGFSGITIGSSTAGNIGIKAIPFNDPVTFNSYGYLNLENDIDLIGQTITLGNEITLNEASGRFYGTSGNITTTRILSNVSAVNVAGLGATLTTAADLGITTVTRGRTNQSWGGKNSVLRYYDISPENNTGLNATLVFYYNDAELNSLAESKLLLFKSTDGGTSYSCEGGTVNTSANTITLTGINDFSRWMAAEIMTLTWNGAGSDFNTAANWTPNATPSTFYNLAIPDVATDPIVNQAPATPAVCNELDIASEAVLTIAPGKSLTVNSTLTNNSGNAGLVIKSDATGTGSLIHSTASVPGTVERYIAAWTSASHGWHFFSSPIPNQAINTTFVDISGTISNQLDLYKWNEPENLWINIKNDAGSYNKGTGTTNWSDDANPVFETGKGYMTAFGADQTKTFTGTLNAANIPLPGLTNTTSKTNRGWHLVGNPFSSAIKWSQGSWLKSNIGSVAQIWNESSASYTVLASDGIIPAHNGFIVYVNEGFTGALTIPADARLHSTDGWYKNSASENEIVLVAPDPEGKTAQESIIGFNPDATEDFDMEHDSYFMAGFAPMFYSISQNQLFALNTLPELKSDMLVPMGFVKNQSSNFTIELTQNITGQTIYLVDLKTNNEHKISESSYSFTSESGDDANRFLLKFGTTGIWDKPSTPQINAWVYNNMLYVNNPDGNTEIEVFGLTGKRFLSTQLTGLGLQSIPLYQPTGLYLIRLTSNGKTQTIKANLNLN